MRGSAESLFEELLGQVEGDAQFDIESFLAAHPEHAEELNERLERMCAVGMMRVLPPAQAALLGGRYRILGSIGRGGMSSIYEVEDEELGRRVALKLLNRSIQDDERLLAEARVTSRLEHPGIVAVHDLGFSGDGRPYFVMRWVRGESLRDVLERLNAGDEATRLAYPLARQVDIVVRVCEALSYAHEQGVLHRDLKPANVMVGGFGEVQLMDWGLALPPREGSVEDANWSWGTTATGELYGTPSYLAPEQALSAGRSHDERTDVFGVGALLAHFITGRPPYWGSDIDEVVDRARKGRRNDPWCRAASQPVPRELVAVMGRAMDPNPEHRYASVAELRRDLEAFQRDERGQAWRDSLPVRLAKWARRRPALATGMLGALILGALSAVGATLLATKVERVAHLERVQRFDLLAASLPVIERREIAMDAGGLIVLARAIDESLVAFARAGLPLDGSLTKTEWIAQARQVRALSLDNYAVLQGGLYALAFELSWSGIEKPGARVTFRRVADLLSVLESDPWQSEAWGAVRDLVFHGDDRLLAMLTADDPAPPAGRALFRFARFLRAAGYAEQALDLYELALLGEPNIFWAQLLVGNRYAQRGNWQRAIRHYVQARSIDQGAPGPLTNLCNAFRNTGELDLAVRSGEQAVNSAPESARAHYNLGLALGNRSILSTRAEDRPVATRRFARTLELDPDHRSAHQQLAHSLYFEGRYEEAIAAAHETLEIFPGDVESMKAIGTCYWTIGELGGAQRELALEWFRRACAQETADVRTFQTAAGRLHQQGWVEAAILYEREAPRRAQDGTLLLPRFLTELEWLSGRRRPDDADAFLRMGLAHMGRDEARDVVRAFQEALAISTGYSELEKVLEDRSWDGFDLGRWLHLAARYAARSALGKGYAHDPRVAVLDELDLARVPEFGVSLQAATILPQERVPLAELEEEELQEEHAALGIEWLTDCLVWTWRSSDGDRELVNTSLEAPELRALVADGWSEVLLDPLEAADPALADAVRRALR